MKARILLGILFAYSRAENAGAPTATLGSGLALNNIDTSVRPQDDFYRFVNNGWLKTTPIPADKSNYGAFTTLFDQSLDRLKSIMEESAAAKAAPGSETQKVGDFYKSYLDTDRLETLALAPVESAFKEVDGITSKAALARWFARSQRLGAGSPVLFSVNQHQKDPTHYIGYLSQGGLGLPDRDYYFKDDEPGKAIRAAYLKYIETMFAYVGFADPASSAQKIYALEEKLAKGQWTQVENRDPQKTYNKVETAKLSMLTSDYEWKDFMNGLGIAGQPAVIVQQPTYITAVTSSAPSSSSTTAISTNSENRSTVPSGG